MSITLQQVAQLIQEDDAIIISNQEEGNQSLKSMDNNLKKFLENAKNRRGDELEAERERNKLLKGIGRKGAGGAAAGGLGAATKQTLADIKDSVANIRNLGLAGLAFATLSKSLGLAFSALSATAKGLKNVFDDRIKTQRGLQRIEAEELRKKMKAERLAARKEADRAAADEKKLRAEAAEAHRRQIRAEKDAKAAAARGKMDEAKIKMAEADAEYAKRKAAQDKAGDAELRKFEAKERSQKARELERDAKATKSEQLKKAQGRQLRTLNAEAADLQNDPRGRNQIPEAKAPAVQSEAPKAPRATISSSDLETLNKAGYSVEGRSVRGPDGRYINSDAAIRNARAAAPTLKSPGMGDALPRALNLFDPIGQAELAAEAGARAANATKSGAGRAIGKGLGATARVLGSTPLLVAELILSPSALADGTMTGHAAKLYNDMVTLMSEGGPSKMSDINMLHNALKTFDSETLQSMGLDQIANMSAKDLERATGVLHDRFKWKKVAERTSQYAPSANYDIGGGGNLLGSESLGAPSPRAYKAPEKSFELRRIEEEVAAMKAGGGGGLALNAPVTNTDASTRIQNNNIDAGSTPNPYDMGMGIQGLD